MINQDESQKIVAGSSRMMCENMTPTTMFTSKLNHGSQRQKKSFNPNVFCDFCHMKGHLKVDCHKLLKCDFCHKTGHLRRDCYMLIGYPPDYKGKRKVVVAGNSIYDIGHAKDKKIMSHNSQNSYLHNNKMPTYQLQQDHIGIYSQQSVTQSNKLPMSMLTPSQHQQLLRMLETATINESHGTTNMAGKFFLTDKEFLKWIVDTSATNHMIGDPKHLHHEELIENVGKFNYLREI